MRNSPGKLRPESKYAPYKKNLSNKWTSLLEIQETQWISIQSNKNFIILLQINYL